MATVDLQLVPEKQVQKIYDPANGVNATADPTTSLTARQPKWLAFEGLVASTVYTIQARIHPAGVWHDIATVDGTVNALAMVEFSDEPQNFIRVVRTTGTVDAVIYAQLLAG